jgi:thiosulfate/3-mercaptopyruvate sulfurtransferase
VEQLLRLHVLLLLLHVIPSSHTARLQVYGCFEADMQPQLRTTLEDLQQLPQLAAQTDPAQQQQRSDVLILDTRNVQQYRGEVRRGPRGGRIPGAVSLPRAQLLDDDTELFKPLEQQKQLLQQAGVQLSPGGQQRVVLYCNGGVAACTAALALHRLGHRDWAVYDGSWNEYSRADSMPVEV